jgi:hypothetical protein
VRTDVQTARLGRAERALGRLLRRGHVGAITHVSVVDHQTNAGTPRDARPVAPVAYVQLRTAGIRAFEALRSVLGVDPVAIVARSTTAPWCEQQHGTLTEAVIEMKGNVRVLYHGSLVSNRDEYTIRVDGDRGVLRSSRWGIWWRKRGWPAFVPIWATVLPGRTHERRRPGANTEDSLWSAAMTDAVIQSDRTGRVVRLADLFSEGGPVNAAAVASGRRP